MALKAGYSQAGMSRIKIIILAAIISLGVLAVILASVSARYSAANQNRLSDVAQIYKALEVFYDQNGYYPYGSPVPERIADYLDYWPTPPGPAGMCSTINDVYLYSQKSLGSDFAVTFCLSDKVGSLSAGIHTLSLKGIQ